MKISKRNIARIVSILYAIAAAGYYCVTVIIPFVFPTEIVVYHAPMAGERRFAIRNESDVIFDVGSISLAICGVSMLSAQNFIVTDMSDRNCKKIINKEIVMPSHSLQFATNYGVNAAGIYGGSKVVQHSDRSDAIGKFVIIVIFPAAFLIIGMAMLVMLHYRTNMWFVSTIEMFFPFIASNYDADDVATILLTAALLAMGISSIFFWYYAMSLPASIVGASGVFF